FFFIFIHLRPSIWLIRCLFTDKSRYFLNIFFFFTFLKPVNRRWNSTRFIWTTFILFIYFSFFILILKLICLLFSLFFIFILLFFFVFDFNFLFFYFLYIILFFILFVD